VDRYGPLGVRLQYRDLDDGLRRLGHRREKVTPDADRSG
jgi:hypothetical protein